MRVKNWKKFQHFKDRRPPWIKLHREVMDQRDISLISDRSFRVLIMLWLLASEDNLMEGNLPDIPEIAFRLRMQEKEILNSLQELTHFVEQDDIRLISNGYQLDAPETETETETETEKTKESTKEKAKKFTLPAGIDPIAWAGFVDMRKQIKSPLTPHAKHLALLKLEKLNACGHNPNDILDQSTINGWKGLFEIKDDFNKEKKVKTFGQQKIDNIKEAMRGFMGGEDAGPGQSRVYGADGRNGDFIPIGYDDRGDQGLLQKTIDIDALSGEEGN